MQFTKRDRPPPLLWKGALAAVTLLLAGGLLLSAAIGAGWNNPRPADPPTWRLADPLLVDVTAPTTRAALLLDRPTGDFTLEAVATPLDDPGMNGYGLVFRAQSPEQYRVLAVSGDGHLTALQVDGDVETALLEWQEFPHVRRGQAANRLRLSCRAGTCRLWVNDEYVASIPDTDDRSGDNGVWAGRLAGGRVQVEFRDITIWD